MVGNEKILKDEINRFFNFFDDFTKVTSKLKTDKYIGLIKRPIYLCILDTLARCVSSPKYNYQNRLRFTSFIKNFCEWQDHTRISLLYLVRFLQIVRNPEFEELRKFANQEINKWPNGQYIFIDNDPTFDEIIKIWPKDSQFKEPLEKVSLESLMHLDLLYKFRNIAIHEIGKQASEEENIENDKPYYKNGSYCDYTDNEGIKSFKEVKNTWELVCPVNFLEQLVRKGITNLKKYCEDNELNPYKSFVFGTYWLEQLNL